MKTSATAQVHIVPWHRFWCPLGGVIHCSGDGGGFLTDPEDDFGRHANPQISRLSALLPETGPLVLCGEPGIGKSTELAGMRAMLEANRDGPVIWIIFRDIADAADFRRQTLDSAVWQEWRAGTARLTLVVDGVDEGLLRVPNFVNDLTALLKGEPITRLRLVLACRTAEWPLDAGRRLLALWSDEKVKAFYELCPLRRVDAELAATVRGTDAAKFLEAVWQRGVTGLAARPVTLFFLLREFRDGELPATHRELYERGTENLAREINPSRLELLRALRKTERHCSDAERMDAARRLAALLLLTGRSAIWQSGAAFEEIPSRDLPLEAAEDGAVSREAAAEAVESALFTSLGERRFGFAHQTFAECLAAQHLAALPLVQLRRLLCQRDARGEHVIPQLAELAAWTAGYHPAFCEHLLSIEPEILLRSDVTRLQGALKGRLVAALLAGAEREEIFDGMNFERFLDGLKHPALTGQLRPVIGNSAACINARRMALTITRHCVVSELTDDVLKLVCDRGESQALRDRAASALEDIIPSDRLMLLIPLARGEVGSDPDDTIRGCALRGLIPRHWKIRDALPCLETPRNGNFIGAYHVFLDYEAAKLLEDSDVEPALLWLCSRAECFDSLHPADRFAQGVVARAVRTLGNPTILAALVRLWHSLGRDYALSELTRNEDVQNAFRHDRTARQHFVTAFLNHPEVATDDIFQLRMELRFLSDTADLDWLLDQLPLIPNERRVMWVKAIAWMTSDVELTAPCWDKLLLRISEFPEMAAQYEWLRAWALDEPCAIKAKEDWLKQQEWQRKAELRKTERVPYDYRGDILHALAEIESGSGDAWFQLWQLLRNDDADSASRHSSEVQQYPAWAKLSSGEQDTCRTGARAYLVHKAADANGITPNTWGVSAGRGALSLLMDLAEGDEPLRYAVSGPWLVPLVGHNYEHEETNQRQIALLYRLNPDACIAAILEEARRQLAESLHPSVIRSAKFCWDARISAKVVEFLDCLTSPAAVYSGIEELSSVDAAAAAAYALRNLSRCAPQVDLYPIGLYRALVAALLHAPVEAFPTATAMMSDDEELQRVVWRSVLDQQDHGRGRLFGALDEAALALLYENVQRVLPSKDDPPWRGGNITPNMSARRMRDQIPSTLAARATEAGCRELLRLATALPDQSTGLRWTYREAVTNIRRNLWQPPSPDAVKRVLAQSHARLLNSDDDLLELVLESLGRLQTKLTAQMLPAAETLWHWDGAGQRRTNFRPKDEESLSDDIARWLTDDIGPSAGVVVGREVQPRRGRRTDVLVEAAPPAVGGGFEKFTVVIEVKGCWHAEVRTALRTQLADDYLRPHGWRCGIYLVGWFVCPRWAQAKSHLNSATAQAARAELDALSLDFADGKSDLRIAPCLLDCTF